MDPKAIDEIIQNRRTIKPPMMSDAPVSETDLRAVLESARWAPSHGLTEPWRFRIFRGPGQAVLESARWAPSHGLTEPWRFRIFRGPARQKLADAMATLYQTTMPLDQQKPEKLEKMRVMPLKAPVVMLVWMARQPIEKIAELEEIEAVACAVQNMQLAATARGLGTFWSTPAFLYTPEMNAWMGIGTKDRCLGIFYVGHPANPGEWPKGRRQSIDDKVEWVDA